MDYHWQVGRQVEVQEAGEQMKEATFATDWGKGAGINTDRVIGEWDSGEQVDVGVRWESLRASGGRMENGKDYKAS